MSDPRAKAERSAAKDIRQGVKPQKERAQVDKKRKKIEKPYEVWWKWPVFWARLDDKEWMRLARFKTRKEAEQYIEKQCRGWRHPNIEKRTQYKIKGPDDNVS